MKVNYQKQLEEILKTQDPEHPKKLLLQSCCGPCSSYVLEYLSNYFEITVYYYNPNIDTEEEYLKRLKEQERLIKLMVFKNKVHFKKGKYDRDKFKKVVKGLEQEKEGGLRCFGCYALRMEAAAKIASEEGFDYFTTTLSVSPHKNAEKINEIGEKLEKKYGVKFLSSDFKKSNGYKRSIELSKLYNLYRQNFCGCTYSKIERMKKEINKLFLF